MESEKGVPRFKENVGKSNPFIILETSGTGEKHGRHFSNVIPAQRSKLRGKGTKLRKKKKIGRSRNRFNLKSAEKQAKNRRFPKENLKKPVERLLIGGAGAGEQRLGNFDLLLFVILMLLLLCSYCYFFHFIISRCRGTRARQLFDAKGKKKERGARASLCWRSLELKQVDVQSFYLLVN